MRKKHGQIVHAFLFVKYPNYYASINFFLMAIYLRKNYYIYMVHIKANIKCLIHIKLNL